MRGDIKAVGISSCVPLLIAGCSKQVLLLVRYHSTMATHNMLSVIKACMRYDLGEPLGSDLVGFIPIGV